MPASKVRAQWRGCDCTRDGARVSRVQNKSPTAVLSLCPALPLQPLPSGNPVGLRPQPLPKPPLAPPSAPPHPSKVSAPPGKPFPHHPAPTWLLSSAWGRLVHVPGTPPTPHKLSQACNQPVITAGSGFGVPKGIPETQDRRSPRASWLGKPSPLSPARHIRGTPRLPQVLGEASLP